MKKRILSKVRRFFASLFSGEGKPLSRQEDENSLPCNYYSEF